MQKEVIKNTGIYISTGALTQGITFLFWLVLAWWLAPSQFGLYALVMFVIDFFSAISIFGLDSAITRFYYTKESVSSILSNALTIFLGSSLLSLILFFFTAKLIPLFISGLSNILEKNLFLFLAIIFLNSLFNFALVHYTALKKSVIYAKLNLLKILLFCFFSLGLAYFGFGVLGLFYALLLSSLFVVILFIFKERRKISFQILSPEIIKNLASYSFPLMLYSVLGIIVSYFSRLLLDKYNDLATLGVYSFFLMLTLQVNGLWSSFNRAWTPEIFSKFSENKEKAIESVKFMTFFSSFIYLLGLTLLIVFGELFLFKLVFKEIYLSNIHLFYILLLGSLFGGIHIASYPLYYYENRTKTIFLIYSSLSLVNVFLTLFLVKNFSQTGAALSYFLMSILTAIIYMFTFKKIIQIPKEIINWTLFLSSLMVLNIIIFLKTSSSVLFLVFIILGIILAYKIGNLSEKKYLFVNLLNEIKIKMFL
jgi:O-antigen/teichoic acid export membrane protein